MTSCLPEPPDLEQADAPIIVTGLGRSGTTWMQWFLSQHPRIHIHGQFPNLRFEDILGWFQTLDEAGRWAEQANRKMGYRVAHYAGSDSARTWNIFRRAFRDFMTGYGPLTPRWGLKWIGLSGNDETVGKVKSLWPDARWVVCIRDPFLTVGSVRNTFVPDMDMRQYADRWVNTCKFAESHDPERTAVVQLDKLTRQDHIERQAALNNVLATIGETPSRQTDSFLRRWPVVHKRKPDAKRKFTVSREAKQELLDEVPELGSCMLRLGYHPDEA